MQNRERTRMQRLKAALTKPITIKGMISTVAKAFRRNEPEPIRNIPGKNPAGGRADSNLWVMPVADTSRKRAENISKLRAHALELHRNAQKIRNDTKRTRPNHEEANLLDLQAVDTYMKMGWVQEATMIGHEFQQRGHFKEAAQIYSTTKDENAFFRLVEHLHNVGKHDLAANIVRWNAGLRGVVKYNEIYKSPHPELVADFDDEEIIQYAREMKFQKKGHHVFQLAELCESSGRYGIAAELYTIIGLSGVAGRCKREETLERADALRKERRFLEAGEALLGLGMYVEIHDIAREASEGWRNIEASLLFDMVGDKASASANRHIAAVAMLETAKRMIAEGDTSDGVLMAKHPIVLKSALELAEEGKLRRDTGRLREGKVKLRAAYEIAESLKEMGKDVGDADDGKLLLRASMIYRGGSPEQVELLAA